MNKKVILFLISSILFISCFITYKLIYKSNSKQEREEVVPSLTSVKTKDKPDVSQLCFAMPDTTDNLSCDSKPDVSGVVPLNSGTKPEAILQNFKLQQASKNKKENWILTANIGKIFHASNKIECEKLKCVFTKNNKIMAVLKSQNGFVDQNKKEANLYDKVFGNLYDLDFEGKNIKYDFDKHVITSNEKTIYKHPKFKMFTNSSIAEIKKNRLSMKNGIETEIYLN